MPGLYFHIPFCKQACHYCNFHFSTSLRQKSGLVSALLKELVLRQSYLGGAPLDSIYFGGGTPSLLDIAELVRIFSAVGSAHPIVPGAEVTLEANPDDLSPAKLADLKNYTPVNRLSIGIQSFGGEDLRWMNRAHNAAEARACIRHALAAGFDDLSIDLIYGAPTTSDEQWEENLKIIFGFGIPHLSCYCLTVEEGTALGAWVRKGLQAPVDEEKAVRQFGLLMDMAAANRYEHYEISNFALPGRYARHNSSYWSGEPYLGIGPSAHSYDRHSRQWNIANNALYIKALDNDNIPCEREILTPAQRYNEYVMTALRTMWGIDLEKVRLMGADFASYLEQSAQPFIENGTIEKSGGCLRLTPGGKFLADGIASELFYTRIII